ncbi:high frequency lysogenization protein [Colwellia chukchiensis]|uniref:High frequency lysogenization protein HflD homolog n=1 Tax=Colwellia chukchiensis TaxID=641665 RepID=A0A1H7SPQ6_9GAMM|nr:high frequency lysogenization protein HflD [Colwellia chukchiensis]SEL74601.1 high frequency lysogenization protein [Colwellia chukchiensis]
MNNLQKQTITMAAICQAAVLVQNVARTGVVDDAELSVMLNSIMITSPNSILEVYGNELAHLKTGLLALVAQLGNDNKQKDPELTRYVVSLLGLERRLAHKKNQLARLGERIEQSQRQLEHYEITSETLLASLASIYSDLLSPISTPIQVAGDPNLLKQQNNQQKIRALLLAGVRSSVLWRQVGGQRRKILFGRTKMVECAQQLLKDM